MNPESTEPADLVVPEGQRGGGPGPLELARWLEQASRAEELPGESHERPGGGFMGNSELQAALEGLQLVRRAARGQTFAGPRGETLEQRPASTWRDRGETREMNHHLDDVGQAGSPASQLDLAGGTRIGRFEILGELGRGGFGIVFLARDPQLDRRVAIKVPRPELLLDREARQRFDREARLGSLLSHPNIVPIHESRFDGPVAHIVFAWCDGPNLAEWLRDHHGRVDPRLAARLVVTLAQAVHYAHQRGVIHRDLKPANILVERQATAETSEPDGGHDPPEEDRSLPAALRIMDFGLARTAASPGSATTRAGAIVGTPAYMSPEQARGETSSPGEPSDVYALGAILHELLTGQPPFARESELATLRAVEHDPVRPLHQLRPEIPADLEAICLKCLEKNPVQRYGSAFDLHADLERFLAGQPVTARRITRLEQTCRWCRRNPALAAALGLVLAGLGFALWQWWRAEHNAARAQAFLAQSIDQRDRAERNLERAETAIEQMLNELGESLTHIPRLAGVRTRLLEQALVLQQQLAIDESGDPRLQFRMAQSQRRMARIWRAMGRLDEALTMTDRAEQGLARAGIQWPEIEIRTERAKLAQTRALIQNDRNAPDLCLVGAKEAANSWRRVLELKPEASAMTGLAAALRLQGEAHEALGDFDAAETVWRGALEQLPAGSLAAAGEGLAIERGQLLNSLGVLAARRRETEIAEDWYRQSLDVLLPVAAAMPERVELGYNVAVTAYNLGNAHHRRREYREAAEAYQSAFDQIDVLVSSFPDQIRYRQQAIRIASGLGSSRHKLGAAEPAAAILGHGLELERQLPPDIRQQPAQASERATLLNNLGSVCLGGLADPEQARAAFAEARAILRESETGPRKTADGQRRLSLCEGNLSACHIRLGELELAEAGFRAAIETAVVAWELDRGNPLMEDNLDWQLEQLALLLLRRGAAEEVVQLLDQHRLPSPAGASRDLRLARIAGECIARLDQLTSQSGANPAKDHLPDSSALAAQRFLLVSAIRKLYQSASESGVDGPAWLQANPALAALVE